MSKFDELKKLAEAATPGPWRTGEFPKEMCGPTDVVVNNEYGLYAILIGNTNFPGDAKHNAAYAAAANPAAILELLAIQAQLVEALRKSQGDINWMLNNRQFLNGFVFSYISAALDAAGEQP